MRNVTTAAVFALLSTAATAESAPLGMSVDRLLDICAASTVAEAAAEGDELGWPSMGDAQTPEWRRNSLACNGGSVRR
ncbi:MAG: hypothetical protein QM651_12030 [Rhodoblastus sp.]